ncbi:unnamed protein product [Withania somnifera]
MVVDLLLRNGIHDPRIFQPSFNVLDAIGDTNISLIVTVQQNFLKNVVDKKTIEGYLYDRVKFYVDKGVKFGYVYIGHEPFTKSVYAKTTQASNGTFQPPRYQSNNSPFHGHLSKCDQAIEGDFREDIKEKMIEFLDFLNTTGGPFIINTFPIYTVTRYGFNPEFAFFDNKSKFKIIDGNNTYNNLFTFIYDTTSLCYDKGKVMCKSRKCFERFHRGLLKYMAKMEGTPLRPNRDISTVRMPNRWCVFDGKTDHNETLVLQDYDYACDDSDCSAFGAGATCDHLSFTEKVSYAYNMRYQTENQNMKKCNLIGAMITTNNPSTPDCEFPVEILTAEVVDGGNALTKRY